MKNIDEDNDSNQENLDKLPSESANNYSISDFEYAHTMSYSSERYVIKCKDKQTQYILAMKVMRKPSESDDNPEYQRRLIEREIIIHASLSHPNIVQFVNFFTDTERYCILMEYCNCGNLYQANKKHGPLGNVITATFMFQICSALEFIHSRKVMYRDLKTDNLLLTMSGVLKLCDFGSAAYFKGGKAISFVGTVDYVSPEMAAIPTPQYDHRTDIWSVGVILYELITEGSLPFYHESEEETLTAIRNLEFTVPKTLKNGSLLDVSAVSLIHQILVLNPDNRPTLRNIIDSEYVSMFSEGSLITCDAAVPVATTARNNRQFD